MIRVAVGSRNPVKLEGTKIAFERMFGERVEVVGVEVRTSVGPQPMRYVEILLGAVERAVQALERVPTADYGVGIEAGFFRHPFTVTGYLDVQVAVIVDRDMRMTVGWSPAFEFPCSVISALVRGEAKEAEEVMERVSGVERIGEREGAVGFLTGRLVDRLSLTVLCVTMALIPRKNEHLYSAEWPDARRALEALKRLVTSSVDVFSMLPEVMKMEG